MLTGNDLAKFRAAVLTRYDVLDAFVAHPPEFHEGMNVAQFMLRTKRWHDEQAAVEGKAIFADWRRKWACACAEYLRLWFDAQNFGRPFPEGALGIREVNAIYTLLAFGSVSDQDDFFRGGRDFKDALIAGILADGGVFDRDLRWVELGVL